MIKVITEDNFEIVVCDNVIQQYYWEDDYPILIESCIENENVMLQLLIFLAGKRIIEVKHEKH